MKFSTRARYGLRILMQIAASTNGNESWIQGKDIAKAQDISEAYLEQIMISLKSAGFVKTARGCTGGYALKRNPSEINLLDIIELFEGKLSLSDCVEDKKACKKYKYCPARKIWEELSDSFRKTASQYTLEKILTQKENPEYVI